MQTLPQELYTAAQVRELDRRAIAAGTAGAALMERAGEAAFVFLRFRWPRARRIAVVCGGGNNGGDGYVLARHLRVAGLEPVVLALVPPDRLKGDAAAARAGFEQTGETVSDFAADAMRGCDLIVDALLGTGLEREVAGTWRGAIEAMNAMAAPVFALDVPSGLHADTGAIMGAAVRAAATLTFIALKPGLFTAAGPDCRGEIVLDRLDLDPGLCAQMPAFAHRLNETALRALIRKRPRAMHKGDAGHVLVVGGQAGMGGAVRMAGEAAYRAGAGLVTVATHPAHAHVLAGGRPELIVHAIEDTKSLPQFFEHANVIAVGPGLGQGAWGRALWERVAAAPAPLVVDADALNLLARQPQRREDWILTPHPGEAARLLGGSTGEIQADRFGAARAIAARFGGVCVLKGAGTVVVREGEVALCDRGNPGMASGGMGDILTGVIAALRAQGLAPWDAARLGVFVHAAAGDDAAARGEIGLLATDLLAFVPAWLNRLAR